MTAQDQRGVKIQNAAIAADQHVVVAWHLTRAALASGA
jgi:hypothetical protein